MMTERQRKFREQYKADISPLYNGLLHIAVIYGVGIGALWWAIQRLDNVTWEWALILPVFLSFGIWALLGDYIMYRMVTFDF